MFGLFGGKDWNIIALMFERRDLYQISGQRVKGSSAEKAKNGAKMHDRTVFYAVFNQKGNLLEEGPGKGAINVPSETIKKLQRDLRSNRSIQEVLKALETKQTQRVAKPLVWNGYPPREMFGQETQEAE